MAAYTKSCDYPGPAGTNDLTLYGGGTGTEWTFGEVHDADNASITANTISFSNTNGKILDSGNGFVNAGFKINHRIIVTGSSTDGCNGFYTITAMDDGGGELTVSPAPSADVGAGDDITITSAVELLSHTIAGDPDNGISLDNQIQLADSACTNIVITVDNARAGASVDIVGTDAAGDSQTETALAMNSVTTVLSTKKWRTITSLDFNGFTVGDVIKVYQRRYGVIHETVEDGQYRISNLDEFLIGDGSNSTAFLSQWENVWFDDDIGWNLNANATLTLGEDYNSTGRGSKGSSWSFQNPQSASYYYNVDDGDLYCYGSILHNRVTTNGRAYFQGSGTIKFVDSTLSSELDGGSDYRSGWFFTGTADYTFDRVNFQNAYAFMPASSGDFAVNSLFFNNVYNAISKSGSTDVDVSNCTFTGYGNDILLNNGTANSNVDLINPSPVPSDAEISFAGANVQTANTQFTVDIQVTDEAGANVESATVTCKDKNNNTVFSVSTGGDGKITQQTITYKNYSYNGSDTTVTTYSPHSFEISKDGYKTLIISNVTPTEAIDWRLELHAEDWRSKPRRY